MLKNLVKRSSQAAGLEPGTPVYTGDASPKPTKITLFNFNETTLTEKELSSFEEALPYRSESSVTWINIDSLSDNLIMQEVAKWVGLHPLILEDIVNITQRPKFEDLDSYLFVVLKMLYFGADKQDIEIEQVSFIIANNLVISFQEDKDGDVFGAVRERIRANKGKICKLGADYLAYSLIDAIVDNYFVILEEMGEKIEVLENHVIRNPQPKTMEHLHRLKQKMIFLRKSIWPLREVISGLLRTDSELIEDSTKIFLRDVYDHTIQVIEIVETCRDMVSGLFDMYLSSISNKLNEIMKVLTMISTIFIPLGFIASFYGMNFKHMPELEWHAGYPLVIAIMLTVTISMLLYFRRHRWL
ncbi:MAG: magnesium/cobalt transporter CorA [Candidatus Margulisiibacteriota bacterium]